MTDQIESMLIRDAEGQWAVTHQEEILTGWHNTGEEAWEEYYFYYSAKVSPDQLELNLEET